MKDNRQSAKEQIYEGVIGRTIIEAPHIYGRIPNFRHQRENDSRAVYEQIIKKIKHSQQH